MLTCVVAEPLVIRGIARIGTACRDGEANRFRDRFMVFARAWYQQTMRPRIEPVKKTARSLGQHRQLILNYFPGA